MKVEMCVPCAARVQENHEIKQTAHRREKITCAGCGCRRYGSEYEIPIAAKLTLSKLSKEQKQKAAKR